MTDTGFKQVQKKFDQVIAGQRWIIGFLIFWLGFLLGLLFSRGV